MKIPLIFGFSFRKVNIFHLKNNLRTAADIIDSMSFLWPSCPFWVHARSAFSFREHGRPFRPALLYSSEFVSLLFDIKIAEMPPI